MKDIFLFDLDATLVDFPRAERENFFSTFRSLALPATEEMFLRFRAINDGLWKRHERGEIAREDLIVERFSLLFGEFGVEADVRQVAETFYFNYRNFCFPYEGARELLCTLSRRGRVYLVTNGGAAIQHRHIKDAGFLPYIGDAFISEEVGAAKPAAAYAEYVARHIADFSANRAVFVGDSLTSDMLCARAMGVDFILYSPSGAPEGYGGLCAENYRTLLEILQTL